MPVAHPHQRRTIGLSLCAALGLAFGLFLLCFYIAASTSVAVADTVGESLFQNTDTDSQTLFTRDDGLSDNRVTALFGDERVLWVGTLAGLNRYTVQGRDAGLEWQAITKKDGMADDAVSDLWGDNAGGLWVAHPDGQTSYFDGISWTTYENLTETLGQAYKQIIDTKAEGPLWSIEEAGRIWTLVDGTVGYYVGAVWRPYGQDAGIPGGRLAAVWSANGVWVASENGQIGYFDGANWTTFRTVFDAVQQGYETIAAAGPMSGPLWVVDQKGAVWARNAFNQRNPRPDVRRFAEGRWTNFSNDDGMADGFVEELRLDRFGRVWARHVAGVDGLGGGLSLLNADDNEQSARPTSWTAIVPALSANVTDFWPADRAGVWIGSFFQAETGGVPVGGLTHTDLHKWQRFSLQALGGAAVSDSWLDENDDLWVALASDPRQRLVGGLWRYRPAQGTESGRWIPISGLLDGDVRDLWGDGQGSLWVANAGGVNHVTLRNRRVVSYTQPANADWVAGDDAGNVWAFTFGDDSGVWVWDGSIWSRHTDDEGLGDAIYADAYVATAGPVYLAGNRGLDIWDGKTWKTFAALPGRVIKRIWQDDVGDLWLSSEITPGRPFNLSLNQGGSWKTVLDENVSREMGSEPLAFVRDSQGMAWMGTPVGLYVYRPDLDLRWRGVGPVEGLPSGAVPALYEDSSGTMWAAVGAQVYRTEHLACDFVETTVFPANAGSSQSQESGRVCWDWRVFEPDIGPIMHIADGPNGSILMAGETGLALYHPTTPDLRLDGVVDLFTGETQDGSEPIVLTLERNAVRIDLETIAPLVTARQLSYLYRLEGFDQDWRHASASSLGGKRASVTYAGLSGGVYTFTVSARTNTLDASPEISITLLVLSRPPQLVVESAAVAGRPAERPEAIQAFVAQPIEIQLRSHDDQLEPLTYRYKIEGLGDQWTTTSRPAISFTVSAAGTYTLMAVALDDEDQASQPIGSRIIVRERVRAKESTQLPLEAISVGLGFLALLFIGSAIVLALRRRRRESW